MVTWSPHATALDKTWENVQVYSSHVQVQTVGKAKMANNE